MIASAANELKKIGDKLNSTYKLHFVNKGNLAGQSIDFRDVKELLAHFPYNSQGTKLNKRTQIWKMSDVGRLEKIIAEYQH